MTDPATIASLADRIEKLTGPDRGVDWAIHCRNGLDGVGMYGGHPAYTASIDSAMTLVPERMKDDWSLIGGKYWQALVGPDEEQADAATPALALCAAALRAILQEEQK